MTTGDGIALAGMWVCTALIANVDVTGAAVLVFIAVPATLVKLIQERRDDGG